MPAPTWSWLKMNEASLKDLPARVDGSGLAPAPASAVNVSCEGRAEAGAAGDAFASALDGLEGRYAHLRRASAPGDAADRGRAAADPDGALDVPALSGYQARAVELEEAYTPALGFAMGLGGEASAYLAGLAAAPRLIRVPRHARGRAVVRVAGSDAQAAVAQIDVVAEAGSALELVVELDAPLDGTGLVGAHLRVLAGEHARVDVASYQTAGDGYLALDDEGYTLEEGARVNVRHVVLGAGSSLTGLAADIPGDRARIDVDTSYLGARSQQRDFNYEIRHRGRATQSNMDASGVLAGESRKCLRGTIDLVHGCSGSEGTEHETVLLVDPRVENKTVPTILCDEDDVAGNHGATIGHVSPDQLFYLECRGVSAEDAEALFLRAKLEHAAINAPTEHARRAVCRLGGQLFSNFEEELA